MSDLRVQLAILNCLHKARVEEVAEGEEPDDVSGGDIHRAIQQLYPEMTPRHLRAQLDFLAELGLIKMTALSGAGVSPLEATCEIRAPGVAQLKSWRTTAGRSSLLLHLLHTGTQSEVPWANYKLGRIFTSDELLNRLGLEGLEDPGLLKYLEDKGFLEVSWADGGVPLGIAITSFGVDEAERIDSLTLSNQRQSIPSATMPRDRHEGSSPLDPSTVFVVHGRNEVARQRLFSFLRSIHLKPHEFQQWIARAKETSPSITQILDQAFAEAQAFVILLTPDEETRLREELEGGGGSVEHQARPNVLFEAGMAWGKHPNRTIFVEVGRVRPFSDIAGVHTVRLGGAGDQAALNDLCSRLRKAGCPVNTDGSDWLGFSFSDTLPPFPGAGRPHPP